MRTNTHTLRHVLVLATIVAALFAPAASAAPVDPIQAETYSVAPADLSVAPVDLPSTPPSAPSTSDGFDWGDAGIGAAAILALAAIGAGAATVFGSRSGRRHTLA